MELEVQCKWDGSWYDLDTERCKPVLEGGRYGLKVVFQ
jgi:hypothetical protein